MAATLLCHRCKQRCNTTVHTSVTVVTIDSAGTDSHVHITVKVVVTDSTVTLMYTSLSQRCQLPPLSVFTAVTGGTVSCHRCHTTVHSSVTALSVYIDDTLMLLPALSAVIAVTLM